MARSGPWEMSADAARRVALAAQGFADPTPTGAIDRRHMARVMKRMQVVQLDSVPVVIRTQYLPFHSRLGPYPTSLFDDVAYQSGRWFEAWSHEASLLPVETEPLFRWAKESARQGNTWKNLAKIGAEKPTYVAEILEEVRRAGSVVARDLEEPASKPTSSGPHDGWWNRSDTKNALDWLFRIGEVGVRRTGNFAKVYSPIDQIVPADILALPTPTPEDAQRQLCVKAVRSLGVGTATDIADYFRLPIRKARLRLEELVEDGQVVPASVAGWGQPGFADPEARIPRSVTTATILSPFDPVVWNRDRARRLFDFDYKLEIYTPAAKRRWGYYVLPVLHDTRIVGRLDVKTHREESRLEVKASYLEPGCEDSIDAIAHSTRSLASLVQATAIDVGTEGNIAAGLRRSLR